VHAFSAGLRFFGTDCPHPFKIAVKAAMAQNRGVCQKGLDAAANEFDPTDRDGVEQRIFQPRQPAQVFGPVIAPVRVDVIDDMLRCRRLPMECRATILWMRTCEMYI
jgi:hypothetical protein